MACQHTTLVAGSYRELNLQLEVSDDEYFDLTGATEIVAKFLPDTGTDLVEYKLTESKVVVLAETSGKIKVVMEEAKTILQRFAERQDFDVDVTKDGKLYIFKFEEGLTVKKRLSA